MAQLSKSTIVAVAVAALTFLVVKFKANKQHVRKLQAANVVSSIDVCCLQRSEANSV